MGVQRPRDMQIAHVSRDAVVLFSRFQLCDFFQTQLFLDYPLHRSSSSVASGDCGRQRRSVDVAEILRRCQVSLYALIDTGESHISSYILDLPLRRNSRKTRAPHTPPLLLLDFCFSTRLFSPDSFNSDPPEMLSSPSRFAQKSTFSACLYLLRPPTRNISSGSAFWHWFSKLTMILL